MALDGIALRALAEQFNTELIGAKADKISQPEKDEIVISFRSHSGTRKLLMSASSSNPRVHFTNITKKNPLSAPMFCMLLRKHLGGGKLIEVRQRGLERCIDFCIESYTELGDLTVKHLIVEIMGRHSNIILTDENNKIVDSIKHIDFSVSSVRQVLPGLEYIYPPSQNKINPLTCEYIDIVKAVASAKEGISADRLIVLDFEGISPLSAREMCHRGLGGADFVAERLASEEQKKLCDAIYAVFEQVRQNRFFPCSIYDKSGKPIDFSAIKIEQYGTIADVHECTSISEAVEEYYSIRDSEERKKQKSASLAKFVSNNIDRCAKKIILLKQSADEAKKRDKFKMYGDLITANMYLLKGGEKSVLVQNFYSEKGEKLTIPLDPTLSPQQNAQKYYKKYSKLKTAGEMAAVQMASAQKELEYFESVAHNISIAASKEELDEIRSELENAGYISTKAKSKQKKASKTAPMHFVSSDGFDIYVGKNNIQNDYVTTKLANSSDIWFHIKNFAGSHTVIKLGTDKNVPDRTLLEAAGIAAYYSAAKSSAKVEIDYTQIKNVKKPSGAKPGMVIYEHYSTLYVEPKNDLKRVE